MSITISGGIPDWFVDQFKGDLYHTCQQKESLLASAVRHEAVVGAEDVAFDMIGQAAMEEKSGRNPETPRNDPNSARRWVETTPYHTAYQFDKDDDLQMRLDPMGAVVEEIRYARNRQVDDIVLAAFDATVKSGRRNNSSTITWASMDGDTKYTRTSGGRTIPHDCSVGNCSAADTGMTVEKIQLVREYFMKNEVPMDMPIFGLIAPEQGTDLWGQEEYINIDYNNQRPLATLMYLKQWGGINWIVSNKVVAGSNNDVDENTNVYKNWFWAMDGIILGIADDITVEMSTRDDLSYAQQVYVHMNMGAMRWDEDKICVVECQ